MSLYILLYVGLFSRYSISDNTRRMRTYSCNVNLDVIHSAWHTKMPICDVIQSWTTRPRPFFSASLCLDEWESPLRERERAGNVPAFCATTNIPTDQSKWRKTCSVTMATGRQAQNCVCLLCACDLLKESLQRKPVKGGWESVRALLLDKESIIWSLQRGISNPLLPRTLSSWNKSTGLCVIYENNPNSKTIDVLVNSVSAYVYIWAIRRFYLFIYF